MRKLFLLLVALGLLLVIAAGVFVFYVYPQYVRPEQEYRNAAALLEEGDTVPAALQFETMQEYKDSRELAKRAWLEAGDKSMADGDYAQARTYYLKGGASSEVLKKLDSAYYQMGVRAYAENQRTEAENYFSCISYGSSYLELLDPVRISCAERFLQNGDFDSARKVFHLCGEGSYDEISRLWLDCGKTRLDSFDLDNASYCFAKAMAFAADTDAAVGEIDSLWSEAGTRARQNGDAELAEKCFARTSTGVGTGEGLLAAAYDDARAALEAGDFPTALGHFCEASGYSDANARADELRNALKKYYAAKGAGCYAVLRPDGTVGLGGDWGTYNDPIWTDVNTIAVGGSRFLLGLKADGSVVFHGNGSFGNGEVTSWSGVSAIACGKEHSAAVLSDGRAAACGTNTHGEVSGVGSWSDLISVAAGDGFTVGLTSSGTVVACGDDSYGQCEVSAFSDIDVIACGAKHTVMLRSDGGVSAVGDNSAGQCNVGDWEGITAVFAGGSHTVGLRFDGTLTACGDNSFGQCEVEGIDNVICVACGEGFTLILQGDGTEIKLGNI